MHSIGGYSVVHKKTVVPDGAGGKKGDSVAVIVDHTCVGFVSAFLCV